jgi:uncharacterized RDD family membrane protein YckC
MTWYYADGGRQVGPIEESALDDLVRQGVVRDDTLVWREGMAAWQSHASVRGPRMAAPMPAAPVMTATPSPQPAADNRFCSECGRPFPAGELVAIGSATVCAACKPVFMQRMREGGQALGVRRYAGFWIRFVARLIDGVILYIAQLIVSIPLTLMMGGVGATLRPGANPAALFSAMAGLLGVTVVINLAIAVTYEAYFLSTRGATPGKMVLGLKVIRADGSPVSVGLAIGRYFAMMLSWLILAIGYIMAGFDDEKRSLHDRICETRVIYAK